VDIQETHFLGREGIFVWLERIKSLHSGFLADLIIPIHAIQK
jgi:hypothetical protein